MKFKGEGKTIVWDAEREKELCRFTGGALETDDLRTCEILIGLGYDYEGVLPVPPIVPLEEMTVPKLKEYAVQYTIDLGDATKKEDILAKILAAQDGVKDGN